MKNVLLWIASIFSMLLDAVKKERKVSILPVYYMIIPKVSERVRLIKKGEQTLIIITASLQNTKAYKSVQKYADDNDMIILGSYIDGGKRNFILKKRG